MREVTYWLLFIISKVMLPPRTSVKCSMQLKNTADTERGIDNGAE